MTLSSEEISARLSGRVVGIDVSKWQRPEELWASPPPALLKFICIKASQHNFKDACFREHHRRAREYGLIIGAYHFLDCRSDAATQARAYLKSIEGCALDYHVCDLEGVSDWSSPDAAAECALEWMQIVGAAAGKRPILYTSARHLKRVSASLAAKLGAYRLWAVSYWLNTPPPDATPKLTKAHSDWIMWQWCSDNLIPEFREWFDHRLDTNFFNGTLADLYKFAGKGKPAQDRPETSPVVAVADAWEYNRRRHINASRFLALVERMGVDAWKGRETIILGVAAWQLAHGLDADGKVGTATLEALDAE
jgi:lysozyme